MSRIEFSRVMWVGRATIFMAGLAVMTALLIGVLAAKPAHAETITVNTTSNDPTLTNKCTLEAAITAANTNRNDIISEAVRQGTRRRSPGTP